ncbi:unnamed protein product [Medioppia subpectinata]|uniref:Uncharacterized protein n=1 Tax=Medioppia subpectinata TaxID=1979941 RepID=A0A7R9KWS8_9ACAR|nr:unnamed protein product [Medioppia subpectinata]CAG2111177.1 unnamed protein product [Medioppia subpectinata]
MEATIGQKKWRTDLSHLFKCWSLIKTSELIKDKAYEELKTFSADRRAIERLNQTIKRNDLKTSFDQTISLWNKAIDQYLNQRNFFAAAECMESLAEIEFKFGDKHAKRVSLSTLLKASKYFKKASQPKRALIVLKRVLTILELSPKNDISIIADRYEDCVQLYLSLDLPHLANVSQKMHQFLDPQKAEKASFCSLDKCKLESYDLPMPSRVSTPSTVRTNNSDDEDSYDNQCFGEQTIEHQIEDKEWVQQQIRLLDQHNTSLFATNYTDINDDNCQHTSDEELDLNIKQNFKPTWSIYLECCSNEFGQPVTPDTIS